MRFFFLSSILLILYFFSTLQGDSKQFLEPGSEFKNRSSEIVYIVLELPPGETFKNETGRRLQIFRQMDDLVSESEKKVRSIEIQLDSLNSYEEILNHRRKRVKD